jgi:putative IMPACT (imprinted ancient) family translation regulator
MFITHTNFKILGALLSTTWVLPLRPIIYGHFGQIKLASTWKTSRGRRKSPKPSTSPDMSDFEPVITHGESVVDRKSVFQGHSAAIHQVEHVDIFLSKLKENKKIENAFHNMWAYRIDKSDPNAKIAGKSASIVQDCDDDGEQAAGGRLLNLLQILNVVNVMVVVTRWYGGIQLGPARFKHINNAARDALVKGGFVMDNTGGESSNTQSQTKNSKSSKNKKKAR